jgi:hypothetical protein
MDDLGYVYFYCELFDQVGLTIITLFVKSFHIEIHEMCSKKGCMSRLRISKLRLGVRRGLKKGT